jgi:hypothetical protein
MLLRGFAKGVPTKHPTDETDLAYPSVLKRRHRIQEAVQQGERVGLPGEAPKKGLPDPEVEADEMYQHAREKSDPHRNPDDPPHSRANKARGRGTYENDRPPVLGMVGREIERLPAFVAEVLLVVGVLFGAPLGFARANGLHDKVRLEDVDRVRLWTEAVGPVSALDH